ncbi:DNA repair protein RadA [Thermovirga lienii DSM 17291]|jgi:DNA repair protein RadA/Sms|uniref:DNA repair protein RadA n=1 Tax=Thermovirga lienii (strain ATCC BAA-1197 / DSM 17291 / Cas60314) TaxID=580340 RepID=G7V965_THELD|nr:DNA repair protein RadA [Thermovirga lienii]AER66434.1 DNA repair protein RadA [Thermovirga lienii DSM 17291]KUK42116.1 MAG: DNA repair protein radA [Thermovirga lienii]
MGKKESKKYECIECGYTGTTWSGRCPKCGAWGTIEEVLALPSEDSQMKSFILPLPLHEIKSPSRLSSQDEELDRVLGGGWVPGSSVLLAGEPGIGKSTILLQTCLRMAQKGKNVVYLSGEESPSQVALRAKRLGIASQNLKIGSGYNIDDLLAGSSGSDLVVVDSVQSFTSGDLPGLPGTPSQVRAVAQKAISSAKQNGCTVVMIGHINKEGLIAGPKLLEHMVDTVLLFSGDRLSPYRVLRAVKNRFGATDEMGVYEMLDKGLFAVNDPTRLYWRNKDEKVPGVTVTPVVEGSRAFLVEIQALVATSPFPYPKRTAIGVDPSRLQLLLAVLERRFGVSTISQDVYVNVVGGVAVRGPQADLALCAALASAHHSRPVDPSYCLIGEVGLAGEVRPLPRITSRIKEAKRLGYKRFIISKGQELEKIEGVSLYKVENIKEALEEVGL